MAYTRQGFEKDLKQKLQQRITGNTSEEGLLIKTFKYFDLSNSQKVTVDQFGRTLERLGLVIPDKAQLQKLFGEYDTQNTGSLDYKEFTAVLFGAKAATPVKGVSAGELQAGERALEKLRLGLKGRGSRGIIGLARQFKIMDDDNSKTLSFQEFEKAIKDFRVELTDHEIQAVFGCVDRDRSGSIDYNEFIRAIRGPMNETRKALVNKAFDRLDLDNSGVIEINDLRGVYDAKNHPDVKQGKKTEEDILGEFLETFELHHNIRGQTDQRVTREEFEEYYNNVSASIDSDEYFETMMNNSWKLDQPPPKRRENAPEEQKQEEPTIGNIEEVLSKFRSQLKARGARGIIGMQRQFRIIDDDNSKTLDLQEFKKGLRDFRVQLSEQDAELLFRHIDRNNSGSIDINEFLREVKGPMNDSRSSVVQKVWRKFDRDGSGIIDINDLEGVYEAKNHPDVLAGKKTEEQVLGEFLETFETHHNLENPSKRDQKVTREEFWEYYNNISASIDNDEHFELMLVNAWKLDSEKKQEAPDFRFGARRSYQTSSTPWGTDEPVARTRSNEQLVEHLRNKLKARGGGGFVGFQRQFRIMDDNNSKSLNFEEFWKGMKDFRTGVTQQEARVLFNTFDKNRDGHLSYEEFIHTIVGEMNQFRKDLVAKAFSTLDKNSNGVIELDEIKQEYSAKSHPEVLEGKKTEEEILCEFLETFEVHHAVFKEDQRDHSVTLDEFMEYYNHISASIDNDEYFEAMMNKGWFEDKNYAKGEELQV